MHISNEKYRRLIENMPEGFVYQKGIYNSGGELIDFKFIEANRAFEEMTGLNRQEIIGNKMTEILPEIIDIFFGQPKEFSRLATSGEEIKFEQYMESLQHWYEITAFCDENSFFVTVFRDITAQKHNSLTMEMLSKLAGKRFSFPANEQDYQVFVDDLVALSGAKYVAYNSYEEEGTKSVTRAISGIKEGIRRAGEMLGFELTGKEWNVIPDRLKNIEGGTLVLFNNLYEAGSGAVSKHTAFLLEKIFGLGEVFVIEIRHEGQLIGDFIFFMPRGKTIHNPKNIEMYVNQAGTILLRARAEMSLRESEKRFRSIFENISEGCQIISKDFRYLYVNKAAANQVNKTREEVLGKTIIDFYPGIEEKGMLKIFQRCIANGTSHNVEFEFTRPDGFLAYYKLNIQPVPEGLFILSVDITERKQAEEELKFQNAILNTQQEVSTDGILIVNEHDKILSFNQRFADIWEIPDDIMALQSGEKALNFVLPKLVNPEEFVHRINYLYENKQEKSHEEIALTDGRILERYSASMFGDDGHYYGRVWYYRDITERKKAEEALQSFRMALDSSADNIFIINPSEMKFVDANERACLDTGYSRNELLSMGPQDLKPYFTQAQLAAQFKQVIDNQDQSGVLETIHRRKDGMEFPVEVFLQAFIRKGNPMLVASVRNITERKQAEENLARHTKEIEIKNLELENARNSALEASKAKTEFLATMSHEIRTPMNSILGMADLLAETPLSDEQKNYVEIFRGAGETLLNLINNILDISKIEAGHLELVNNDFNLVELVEKTTDLVSLRANEKDLELACRILPEVPKYLNGDADRLRQVLVNLLSNAIKFTNEGEVILEVKPANQKIAADNSKKEDNVEILFSVKDTGIGVAKDKLEAIFEEFTQVDSSTTRIYGGTGLGLAISRRLVFLMGGELKVESKPGKGSNFYFKLPFALAKDKIQSHDKICPEINLEGIRVLIADDNQTNRLILRETLVPKGAVIQEAANGKDALQELRKAEEENDPYHLLLLDVMMPEMDGFQVVEAVHKELTKLSIIMLSSAVETRNQARRKDLQVDAFLTKPIKRQLLLETIAAFLEIKHREIMQEEASSEIEKTREAAQEEKLEKEIAEMPEKTLEPAPDSTHKSGAPHTLSPHPAVPSLQILLVEDNIDNQLLVKAFLKKTPHLLELAENGQEALDKAKKHHYDLALMDIQMPVMDGYTATKKIRKWERENNKFHLPIIALTAYALEDEIKKALDAGCDAHISKPVKKAALLEAITHYGTKSQNPDHGTQK